MESAPKCLDFFSFYQFVNRLYEPFSFGLLDESGNKNLNLYPTYQRMASWQDSSFHTSCATTSPHPVFRIQSF